MPTTRVVITGLGVISSNGLGAPAYLDALRAGLSGIHPIDEFDTSMLQTRAAATVRNFNPQDHMSIPDIRRTPRMIPFAVAAAREAFASANLQLDPQNLELSRKIGVTLGSGGGGLHFVESQYKKYFTGQSGYSPFTIVAGTHGNLSSELSIQLGLRGSSHVVSTGCASSTDALAYAAMHIRSGTHPLMLTGGADAPITEGILKGFELMRILAKPTDPVQKMSRPFSGDRDGFVLGEGAWMFILEDFDHAQNRDAPILAEVLGYGSTCDAYHRVQPAPDCTEGVRAIDIALQQAQLPRTAIEYVNLHGTGTQLNDTLETQAMHKIFDDIPHGPKSIPMSATKSMIGHPQGACGAAGLAATILSLRAGFIPPTINLEKPDPTCDLDYVPNQARPTEAKIALCNCIAFGSKNSALLVRTFP